MFCLVQRNWYALFIGMKKMLITAKTNAKMTSLGDVSTMSSLGDVSTMTSVGDVSTMSSLGDVSTMPSLDDVSTMSNEISQKERPKY